MSEYRHPRVVHSLIRSLVPIVCPDRGSGLDDDLVAHTERSLGGAPKHIRLALAAGVVGYDLGAILYPRVAPLPAHRLPIAQRLRYFESWWNSPLGVQRELVKALKGFIGLAYYEHPMIRQRLGYDPENWIAKVSKRRLATYSDAIAAQQRAIVSPDPLPSGFFCETRTELERAS